MLRIKRHAVFTFSIYFYILNYFYILKYYILNRFFSRLLKKNTHTHTHILKPYYVALSENSSLFLSIFV